MTLTSTEIRSLVIEILRDKPHSPSNNPYQVHYLVTAFAKVARARQLKYGQWDAWLEGRDAANPEISPHLTRPIWEVVWDLIIEGILRPGSEDDREHTLPYIHVTVYGKEAIKDLETPYDPDGYLKRLAEKVPKVDPVIVDYIAESARSLRHNCPLSSTITLGCASEKAFLLLLDAYADALSAADRSAFEATLQPLRFIKQKHAAFMTAYNGKLRQSLKTGGMSADWLGQLDDALSLLFTYFRTVRNDAGHPTGIKLPKEQVSSHLVLFQSYLRLIYDLLDWLPKNKPLP